METALKEHNSICLESFDGSKNNIPNNNTLCCTSIDLVSDAFFDATQVTSKIVTPTTENSIIHDHLEKNLLLCQAKNDFFVDVVENCDKIKFPSAMWNFHKNLYNELVFSKAMFLQNNSAPVYDKQVSK